VTLKEYLKSLVEDVKAWRRKERRVAPRNVRGRVYEKKEAPESGGMVMRVVKQPTASLTMRVLRADGSVEVIKVPAKVTQNG
jgi:hypothetical protein